MQISRRNFVEKTLWGTGFALLPRPPWFGAQDRPERAMRILVLGGTGFIGPHVVQQAVDRGHAVSMFNRGRTNTHLFPNVEKLQGDRNGQLDALAGRSWDVVIDNSGYYPSHVAQSAELLAGNVNHYFYTSTVDAYRDFREVGIKEDYPLGRRPDGAPEDPRQYYGPLKAECEAAVLRSFPTNNTRVRPGWVAGPGDNNHLFTYWVWRMNQGGDVLAPGMPTDFMQITDVRDLAAFYIDAVERSVFGPFNAVGPVTTMEGMLEGIRAATGSDANLTWVDADFLLANDVKAWTNIPLWWPSRNDWGVPSFGGNYGGVGALALDGTAARAEGFRHHTMAESARDTLQWYQETYGNWPEGRPGLTPTREAEVLRAWRAATR